MNGHKLPMVVNGVEVKFFDHYCVRCGTLDEVYKYEIATAVLPGQGLEPETVGLFQRHLCGYCVKDLDDVLMRAIDWTGPRTNIPNNEPVISSSPMSPPEISPVVDRGGLAQPHPGPGVACSCPLCVPYNPMFGFLKNKGDQS